MIPEIVMPTRTLEPICGLSWVVAESNYASVSGGKKWNERSRFRVTGEGSDQRVLSLDEADEEFFVAVAHLYRHLPPIVGGKMLEVGVNMGLSLSQALNNISPRVIEATNILPGEAELLKGLAPDLHQGISQFHVGTLDALIKLKLFGKSYNMIQGLRSFQNMDTEENPEIVSSYFYWLGQLQNLGDYLIGSVFTEGFLEVASQAWHIDSPGKVKRQTFTDDTLATMLDSSGYQLVNCIEFNETDSMRRFFPWIEATPQNTDLLFVARKNRKADTLSIKERESLTSWLDGYTRCNPYPNLDYDVLMGEMRLIRQMTGMDMVL